MRLIILFITIAFTFSGCQHNQREELPIMRSIAKAAPLTFNSPEKLVSFVNDQENGFVRTKKIGEITYSALLKPVEYLLAQRMINENNKKLKKEDFEDLQYFDLRIQVADFNQEFIKYNLAGSDAYQERVHYCAFDMQHDIQLVDGKDTLNCVLYHYERAFNSVPYGHFMLGFEIKKSKNVNTKLLIFNDRLFDNGLIQFTFLPELLSKEPTLL